MAPDLNSVPHSPRPLTQSAFSSSNPRAHVPSANMALASTSATASRRASQQMPPPTLPLASPSLNILPSNQNAIRAISPPPGAIAVPAGASSNSLPVGIGGVGGDNTGVGVGPGPIRHPRPLTAADLHLQLEREQEAVVNRLTRELSLLRAAQNASVVSNTSSTSAGLPDSGDHSSNHMLSGPSHPVPSQRAHHRSSSSASSRSIAVAALSGSTILSPPHANTGVVSIPSTSTTATAENQRQRMGMQRHDSNSGSQYPQAVSLSRQNSAASSRRSGASSPAASSSYPHIEYFPHGYMHRPSHPHHRESSSSFSTSYSTTNPTSHVGMSDFELERNRDRERTAITSVPTTGRYEEAAFHRHELEAVKRENEGLKRRIRELEKMVRDVGVSIGRERSESASTSASVNHGRGRDLEKEETGGVSLREDDGVRVGESARGGGLR